MTSIWGELKRRNVVKVATAYAVAAWLLVQVAATVLPIFEAPDWILQIFTFFVILGFPLALILSWAYELTPDGMERANADQSPERTANVKGQRLNYIVIGIMAIGIVFLVVDNYVLAPPTTTSVEAEEQRSIAVLPFSNDSAAEENAEFFANGIHDELLTQLAKISSLKVISRTSVMEYRDSLKNMREIGEELGVATILEGGVQRSGNAVRINVQLIDAETDEHLWADSYDRELTAENVFAIQTEMATSIADTLQATLSPQEIERLAEVPTRNLRAYDFYLSGNDYFNRPDNLTAPSLAARQYQRAVEEDPGFALAWAGLARAHSQVYFFRVDPSESRRTLARESVERAFALAPDLPEAHLAMAFFHYHGLRDYDSALRELAIAEPGLPGDSLVYLARAFIYRRMGEFAQASVNLDRAIELDPRNLEQLMAQVFNYGILREYTRAEEYLDRVLDVAPDASIPHFVRAVYDICNDGNFAAARNWARSPPADLGTSPQWLGWTAAIYERDYETALTYLDALDIDVSNFPTGSALVWQDFYAPSASYYGVTYLLAGQTDLARAQFQIARRQVEQALESNPEDSRLLLALGELLAGLGEREAATIAAQRAMESLPTSRDAVEGRAYQLAAIVRVFLLAGDFDSALEELDDYLSSPGFWSIEGLLPDPRFDPIRDDPRFQMLVEKYRRP